MKRIAKGICDHRRGYAFKFILVVAFWLSAAGCGTNLGGAGGPIDPSDPTIDGNRDGSLTSRLGKTFGEPNGSFADAVVAVFDVQGTARLKGSISRQGDLDVYLLGSLLAGDRIVVDATASDATLDIAIAVFDTEQRLVVNNDDRTPEDCSLSSPGPDFCNATLDWIVRHDSSEYYLVVTHSPFAVAAGNAGTYLADIQSSGGFDVPEPARQILLLDFEGGTVDIPGVRETTVGPFDAGAISSIYEGQTSRLKELIRATVAQNYERFNVVVWTSDDPPLPPGTEFSTILVGGFSVRAFGIAADVDLYNSDFCDDAIIYAESFDPSVFSAAPSVEELAVAIGNVTAHEAGHLLGLNHVSDDLDLMDDRSPADAFIEDQEFKESPLSSDIMSIGTQDGPLLLREIVGPAAQATAKLAIGSRKSHSIGTLPSRGGPSTSPIPTVGPTNAH